MIATGSSWILAHGNVEKVGEGEARGCTLTTGCPDQCGLRNWALTEMFLDFRGPQRLPWDPKDGRKLLLGKKHIFNLNVE